MDALEEKARRRIKRFIKTGKHQARVTKIDEKLFRYRSGHYGSILVFKEDRLHRLRKVMD